MTVVELRPAVEADNWFLYELHRRTLGNVIEATWGPWDDAVQRRFHRDWFDPDRLEMVIVDGKPSGVVDAHQGEDGTFYIGRIEISPELQNRGVGTALIRRLIERARAVGASAVELHVLELNRARVLYERLGFRVVAAEPPKLRMRLDLVVRPDRPAAAGSA
jgi:ribosomal protein S18 acetylase RimI-like enzyme